MVSLVGDAGIGRSAVGAGVGWLLIGVFSVDTFSGIFVFELVQPATESTNNKQIITPIICKGFMVVAMP